MDNINIELTDILVWLPRVVFALWLGYGMFFFQIKNLPWAPNNETLGVLFLITLPLGLVYYLIFHAGIWAWIIAIILVGRWSLLMTTGIDLVTFGKMDKEGIIPDRLKY